MHYTPNGKVAMDQTRLGLTFAKEPPKTSGACCGDHPAAGCGFRPALPTTRSRRGPGGRDVMILGAHAAHAPSRKAFRFEAIFEDGKRERRCSTCPSTLRLALRYEYREPLRLPKAPSPRHRPLRQQRGQSAQSDPFAIVRFGPQTSDE